MAMSESAKRLYETMIAENRKAAFGEPEAFKATLALGAQMSATPYTVPEFVTEAMDITEETAADGTLCYVMTPKGGAQGDETILYFHGGAFILQIMPPMWKFCMKLANELSCTIRIPMYKLTPPADYAYYYEMVVAAYEQALESVDPKNLIVLGDSAGAHLAVACCQMAIVKGLPQPALLVPISPWLDMGCELEGKDELDAGDPVITIWGLHELVNLWGREAVDAQQFPGCPLHGPFEGIAPSLVLVGGTEIMQTDAIEFKRLAEEAGSSVRLIIGEGLWHIYILDDIDEAEEHRAIIVDAIKNR